jgi:hypothetical protein
MARVLHGQFAPLWARQNALDDWRRDSEALGGQYLDHERFADSMFEVWPLFASRSPLRCNELIDCCD